MPASAPAPHRAQSPREEIANAASHGAGALLAIAALPVLVVRAAPHGAAAVVGVSVFAATMVMLYVCSTLYHAIPAPGPKRVLRVLDHAAIYLLIAGTYTPFTLVVLRGAWGWSLFGVIWGLAAAGIALKSTLGLRHPRLSTAVYVAMGWLVLVAAGPLVRHLPAGGLAWLLAGGAAYTLGVVFYARPQRRYAHFLWHLAVLAGTACHFVAVLRYAT